MSQSSGMPLPLQSGSQTSRMPLPLQSSVDVVLTSVRPVTAPNPVGPTNVAAPVAGSMRNSNPASEPGPANGPPLTPPAYSLPSGPNSRLPSLCPVEPTSVAAPVPRLI